MPDGFADPVPEVLYEGTVPIIRWQDLQPDQEVILQLASSAKEVPGGRRLRGERHKDVCQVILPDLPTHTRFFYRVRP